MAVETETEKEMAMAMAMAMEMEMVMEMVMNLQFFIDDSFVQITRVVSMSLLPQVLGTLDSRYLNPISIGTFDQ